MGSHSLPSSGEPPAICEISPLVSYSGEVRVDWLIPVFSGVGMHDREEGWGVVDAGAESHSSASRYR